MPTWQVPTSPGPQNTSGTGMPSAVAPLTPGPRNITGPGQAPAASTMSEDEKWVRELYRSILGRVPDPAGLKFWLNALKSGIHTRSSSYYALVRSPEGQAESRRRITQIYEDELGRPPDEAGMNHWLNQIANGKVGPEAGDITRSVRQTPEFRNRITIGGTDPTPDSTLDNDVNEAETRDVSVEIDDILDRYGLGDMKPDIQEWLLQPGGITDDEIKIRMKDHELYKARFPGMALQQDAEGPGSVWTAERYLEWENRAMTVMRDAGLPAGFYDEPSDFTELIGMRLSPEQFARRIQDTWVRVTQAPAAVRARYAEIFGVDGDAALAATFLDPDNAMVVLEEQVATAEIAGFSDVYGASIAASTAEQLAQLGYTGQTASQGLQTVAGQQALFDETISETQDLTVDQGAQAEFGLDPDMQDTIERRARSRTAALSGGGGLLTDQEGIGGRANQ